MGWSVRDYSDFDHGRIMPRLACWTQEERERCREHQCVEEND